jgi:hypothetical protein
VGIAAGVVLTAVLPLLWSCRPGGDAALRRANGSPPPVAVPLAPADLVAYGRGLERELVLNRAALDALRRTRDPDERAVLVAGADRTRTALEGARAAGLTAGEYHRIVVAVGAFLVARTDTAGELRRPDEIPGGWLSERAESLAVWMAPRLDSLRVALVVLRSRVAAEAARRCGEREPSVPELAC